MSSHNKKVILIVLAIQAFVLIFEFGGRVPWSIAIIFNVVIFAIITSPVIEPLDERNHHVRYHSRLRCSRLCRAQARLHWLRYRHFRVSPGSGQPSPLRQGSRSGSVSGYQLIPLTTK